MKILVIRIKKPDGKIIYFQCANIDEAKSYSEIAKKQKWEFDYELIDVSQVFGDYVTKKKNGQ